MSTLNSLWGRFGSLVGLALLLPALAVAASDDIPLDPAVRTGKLPNGLTYYVRQNAQPEKRVELRLAINTGSVMEDEDQRGLAHFVEHMCFNGTKNFPKNDIIHYLESIGVKFGPDINGYTSFDETVYMLTLPSDKEDILSNGIKIMREWAHDVTFDEAEIDKERGVVVEEWRLGRGANQRMADKFLPVVFKNSKYAARLPIGQKEIIEGASYETIKRFYRDWYRPDLMAFFVVGDIDPDKMEQAIKDSFGTIPAPTTPRPRESVEIPDHQEELFSVVSDPENPFNVLLLFFKTDAPQYRTAADLRRRLAERLFVRMMDDRLKEVMQQPNPPFIYTFANYGLVAARTKAAYQLVVAVPDGGIDRGLAALMTENERVQRHGFTAPELHRAKLALMKGLEQANQERDKTESSQLVSEYVEYHLSREPAPGIAFEYQFAKENMDRIPLQEVNGLVSQWLKPENRVYVTQSVQKGDVPVPTDAQLRAVVQSVSGAPVDPYQESAVAAELMTAKPAAGEIVSEKQIAEVGVTELMLSNGVRVVLKPSDFKNDEIVFSAYRPGGQSVFPDDHHFAALMAEDVAGESGVGTFSKIDLLKMLAGKNVSVVPQLTTYFDGMRGGCSVSDLETMLQLAHLYFVAPRRDEAAYTSLVQRYQALFRNLLSNPMTYFSNEAQKLRFQGHRRNPNVLPTDEDWKTLSLDKVTDVYRQRFDDAAGFTFVFVGSFKPEEIKPLLAQYLGSLPASQEASGWKDLGMRPLAGPFEKAFHKGTDPKSLVMITIDRPTEWSREESHLLGSLASILQRAYIDKLREEMSGVYGFQVQASVEKIPYGRAGFQLTLPCAPENVDKLTQAAIAEIKRIQEQGVRPEELENELESQRRSNEREARENGAWLWKLEKVYRDGEDFARVAKPEELVKLVTPEALQAAAVKYLRTEEAVRFVLYPEST